MTTAWPRLMRVRTARKYLDGLDPMQDLGVGPEFHRGEPYYDKAAIDRAVDGNRATSAAREDDPDAALRAWEEGRDRPA